MSEASALALLHLLAQHEHISLPRAAKRLSLSTSELQRLLVALGDDPRFDGLDLVRQDREGERVLLRLPERGRALCGRAA
jgi:DNA-binding IclR family transcriptional regulator